MPAGPIKSKIVEKEHAVVDGVDVSGHWNRMFEQRTIFEYTPELIEKIADIPNAESFANCYQCAKCVAVCPVDVVGNYGPRKLYRYAQTGTDLTEACSRTRTATSSISASATAPCSAGTRSWSRRRPRRPSTRSCAHASARSASPRRARPAIAPP